MNIHNFQGGEVDLDSANVIHRFSTDSFIKIGLNGESRWECWIETNNGDVSELSGISDLKEWLDGTGISEGKFLDLVSEFNLWD